MTKINEAEFKRICDGIYKDRESVCRHNPIGTPEEIVLWMLMGCLISYLSLEESESPCFPGTPDAAVYRDAIIYILTNKKSDNFDELPYLAKLVRQ